MGRDVAFPRRRGADRPRTKGYPAGHVTTRPIPGTPGRSGILPASPELDCSTRDSPARRLLVSRSACCRAAWYSLRGHAGACYRETLRSNIFGGASNTTCCVYMTTGGHGCVAAATGPSFRRSRPTCSLLYPGTTDRSMTLGPAPTPGRLPSWIARDESADRASHRRRVPAVSRPRCSRPTLRTGRTHDYSSRRERAWLSNYRTRSPPDTP